MNILLIATAVLAMLAGLFWHNQPAKERDRTPSDHSHKQQP
jgi:hypothetical protein